jgi:hypothetical protein
VVVPILRVLEDRTKMVLEMMVFSSLNQQTWLVAQEEFIILSCCERFRSYKYDGLFV